MHQFPILFVFYSSENIVDLTIGALMVLDVFIASMPVYFIHVFYPAFFYIFFELVHILRWADGAEAFHTTLDFSAENRASAIVFACLLVLILCPTVHGVAFLIAKFREKLVELRNSISKRRRNNVVVKPKPQLATFGDFMVVKYRLITPSNSGPGIMSAPQKDLTKI